MIGRRQFLTVAAGSAAFMALTAQKPLNNDGLEQDVAGKVARLQGSAIAIQDAMPRILMAEAKIQLGDVISTGPDSRLELEMIDDTVFTLGGRTNFVVMEYEFKDNLGNAAVRLMSGALNTVTGKLASVNGQPFKVETNFGTIGIRGTAFWMGQLDEDFEVVMWKGAGVTVRNRGGEVDINNGGDGSLIEDIDSEPNLPTSWPRRKLDAARATTAFR